MEETAEAFCGRARIPILYEDNHLLVVEKPENVPVQADASGDPNLLDALKEYIKEKYHKPGEVYLGLVHRLDRPVGGVMVFARTSKAASRLTEQFRSHTAKKRYAAVVSGEPKSGETLHDWLYKDETSFTSRVVPADTIGAKEALLSYETLARSSGRALVSVRLETGRPHQIRVQLSHAGYPIVGDQRYAQGARPGEQICLWAYALCVTHPTLKEEMTFFSRPRCIGFADFSAQIALLPAFSVCRGVYLDDEMVVADKNAGVETEGELQAELESLLGEVYPVHRLDANTEGVVLFARTQEAFARLAEQFKRHETEKTYLCIVRGVTEESGALVHYIKKNAEDALVTLCDQDDSDALCCRLSYHRLLEDGELSLVEVALETGRTHQIRVQMAAIGHPVLGDDKYGDRALNKARHIRRQALLAKSLRIDGKEFISERELAL